MLKKELLEKEIYTIKHEGKTILYAPLTRSFNIKLWYDWVVEKEWFDSATDLLEVPDFIHEKSFSSLLSKIKIRLNVTNKCNLNCEYCSVKANSWKWEIMSDDIAFSAIDNLFEYAVKNNANEIELTFSWWEPTLQSEQIVKIIQYLDEKVEWTNIKLVTKLLTNGLIPSDKIPLLSSLFDWVQISWDWNKDNNPRFWNNKQIWEKIWKNIWLFINEWTKVNILTVVSEENYKNLWEIIDSLYNTYWIWDIVLSLKDSVWKADNELINIDYSLLRKNYIDLWKKYRWYDIDIPLTWTDIHSISNHPCWVSVPNFSISPNWIISSCTLSFNNNDTPSYFDIWRLENWTFILNELKVKNLQALSVLWMEQCNDCFGKWHCRWWCMYANKLEWLWYINPQRCDMIRKIIADKILFIAWFKI